MPRIRKRRTVKLPGAIRCKVHQLEILVAAMEANPLLNSYVSGKTAGAYTCQDRQKDWLELKHKLNCAGGAYKDVADWQRTWTDKKGNVKIKARELREELKRTGGGPIDPNKKLNTLEERIAKLIGEEPISCPEVKKESENGSSRDVPDFTFYVGKVEPEEDSDDVSEAAEAPEGVLNQMADSWEPEETPDSIEIEPTTSAAAAPASPPPKPPRSPEPRLRSFKPSVGTRNLVLNGNSADAVVEASVAMAEAFQNCAKALHRANEIQAEHNAAILALKREKLALLARQHLK